MAEETKKSLSLSNKTLAIVVGLVLLVSLGTAGYFWNEAREAKSQTPEAVAQKNQEESNRVIEKLDQILLTESEQPPTVARIDNAQVLKDANPDFYKNAENGDYLVLYQQRAIVYREAENRIVNVAPIINPGAAQQQAEAQGDDAAESSEEQSSDQAN